MAIKGVIFDVGGVLYEGNSVIGGAIDAFEEIKKNFKIALLTNTTRRAPCTIATRLNRFGFKVDENEIFSALWMSKKLISESNSKVFPLLTQDALDYFDGLITDKNPNWVLVGDAAENFNYNNLNSAFRHLKKGAKLLAAAKNRYFKDSNNELSMDAGGFVVALEYAANTKAKLIGKPSKEFFDEVLKSLSLSTNEVIMVGDDIESDIKGAQEVGLKAVLVKTGKFSEDDLNKGIQPDYIIDSIAYLPELLSKING